MSSPLPERIEIFFTRFPLLFSTIEKLNATSIPFMIGGSGCLFLFGNERLPNDVDIYIPDNKHDQADQLFNIKSYIYESATENVRNSNPGGGHSIQLTSHLVLTIEEKVYRLSLDKTILSHAPTFIYQDQSITLLPVEDALLTKALLQRGPDVGKHDVEDIHHFLEIQPNIDQEYLKKRIDELGAGERVKGVFK